MLLYFPYMHPEFQEQMAETPAVDGAFFLDPGLSAGDERAFRPGGLPLDEEKARRLVLDALSFGEQFSKPGDLTAVTLHESARKGVESASDIQKQLLGRLGADMSAVSPEAAEGQSPEALGRAQFTLLLAWVWEEGMMDMLGLEKKLGDVWTRFSDGLGIAEDDIPDRRELELDRAVSDLSDKVVDQVVYPWRRSLEALALLLPEDVVLLTGHPDALTFWKGEGLAFDEPGSAVGLDDAWKAGRLPVWKLLGRSSASRSRQELNRTIAVAVPA